MLSDGKKHYHIFCCNMFVFACPIIAKSQCWLFVLRANIANIHICPHIFLFNLEFNFRYLRSDLKVQGKMHSLCRVVVPATLHTISVSCNNVAPVTNLCLGRATTRSHSSQWSKKKVAVET